MEPKDATNTGTIDIAQLLRCIGHENYRGMTTDSLIYAIQDYRDQLDIPYAWLYTLPRNSIIAKPNETYKQYIQACILDIEHELERRRNLKYEGAHLTGAEIIQAIKNRIDIADVLAWYTDVFTHKRQWTYRCTLHGEDRHPSGVIYRDEKRFHCFVCSRHGDIFDAVMQFERIEMPAAISKLARWVGLDVKPLTRRVQYQDIAT